MEEACIVPLRFFFKFCPPALHFLFVWGLSGDDLGERAEMGGRGADDVLRLFD